MNNYDSLSYQIFLYQTNEPFVIKGKPKVTLN